MIHARNDYNRIQDPAGLIPQDEPVFLFRGQDHYAPKVLEFYASLQPDTEEGRNVRDKTLAHVALMNAWPTKKQPDCPK